MKFFNNKKAITLIELITTITISWILFLIIFVFMTDSVEQLVNNDVKISSIDEWFTFKDVMWRFVRWWYSDAQVFTWITDPSYTWTTIPNPNNVLYLKKLDSTEWMLLWIVSLDTHKLQRNYVYWDNFLWYRFLSVAEMAAIDTDNSLIYTKIFSDDKIFKNLRMKDFNAQIYNYWYLLDIYFSVINLFDDSLFYKDFADFYVDKLVIDEYNLVY